jgi:Ran GTPase-activating protein (RanGAP) involved in mRNA processing and transport
VDGGDEELCRGAYDKEADEALITAIEGALPGYSRIADVAMGEPPNFRTEKRAEKQWFGYIRTMVFVSDSSFYCRHLQPPTVVRVPCGIRSSIHLGTQGPYPTDVAGVDGVGYSPDKGGMLLYFEELHLCAASCHLAATNAYGMPESVFDKRRFRMLRRILDKCPPAATTTVCLGDLNFRIEMHAEPELKTRGGDDMMDVLHVVEDSNSNPSFLHGLFEEHDQLHLHLCGSPTSIRSSSGSSGAPDSAACLEGFDDLLAHAFNSGHYMTPTYALTSLADHKGNRADFRREYKLKRTPSWTDRILCRGEFDFGSFSSVPEVLSSDHEPVRASLTLWVSQPEGGQAMSPAASVRPLAPAPATPSLNFLLQEWVDVAVDPGLCVPPLPPPPPLPSVPQFDSSIDASAGHAAKSRSRVSIKGLPADVPSRIAGNVHPVTPRVPKRDIGFGARSARVAAASNQIPGTSPAKLERGLSDSTKPSRGKGGSWRDLTDVGRLILVQTSCERMVRAVQEIDALPGYKVKRIHNSFAHPSPLGWGELVLAVQVPLPTLSSCPAQYREDGDDKDAEPDDEFMMLGSRNVPIRRSIVEQLAGGVGGATAAWLPGFSGFGLGPRTEEQSKRYHIVEVRIQHAALVGARETATANRHALAKAVKDIARAAVKKAEEGVPVDGAAGKSAASSAEDHKQKKGKKNKKEQDGKENGKGKMRAKGKKGKKGAEDEPEEPEPVLTAEQEASARAATVAARAVERCMLEALGAVDEVGEQISGSAPSGEDGRAQYMANCCAVRKLLLQDNNIDREGARFLARAGVLRGGYHRSSSVDMLDLGGNQLGDDGVEMLLVDGTALFEMECNEREEAAREAEEEKRQVEAAAKAAAEPVGANKKTRRKKGKEEEEEDEEDDDEDEEDEEDEAVAKIPWWSGHLVSCQLLQLHLGGNGIGVLGAAVLGAALEVKDCALQCLSLRHNHLGHKGAAALAAGLQNNRSLSQLDVWGNQLRAKGAAKLLLCLTSAGPKSALRQLGLGNNLIKENAEGAFAAALKSMLDSKVKLQTLELQYNMLDSSALKTLVLALDGNRPDQLHTLNLRNNSVGGKLRRLSARKGGTCWKPSVEGLACLGLLLEGVGKKAGKPKAGTESGEQKPHGLSVIDLQANRITAECVAPLLEALSSSSLTQLELSDNMIGNGVLRADAKSGQWMQSRSQGAVETAGAKCEEALAASLRKNVWLQTLGLRACGISDTGAVALAAAVDPRAHAKSGLRLLDMRSNPAIVRDTACEVFLAAGHVVASSHVRTGDGIDNFGADASVAPPADGGVDAIGQKRLVLL